MASNSEKGFLICGPLGMAVWRYEREGEDLLVVLDVETKQWELQVVRLTPQGNRYASTLLAGDVAAVEEAAAFVFERVKTHANGWIDLVKREAG